MSKPMGVSQWKKHGKKYGYWKYFLADIVEKERKRIKKAFYGSLPLFIPPKAKKKFLPQVEFWGTLFERAVGLNKQTKEKNEHT